MKIKFGSYLLIIFGIISTLQLRAQEIDVYFLGGQSNMQGIGQLKNLTAVDKQIPNVYFYSHGKIERFVPGVTQTSQRRTEFGPEIGFVKHLAPSKNPILIIKYALSGMPLHHGWNGNRFVGGNPRPNRANFYPGIHPNDPNRGRLYIQMVNYYQRGLNELSQYGLKPNIKGFLWMQGEQDSKHPTSARSYAASLNLLKQRLQQDFNTQNIPMVYGQVLPHHPPLVRFRHRHDIRDQMARADMRSGRPEAIKDARMVSTDGFPLLPDTVHYSARGQMMLGTAMAKAMNELQQPKRTFQIWKNAQQIPGFPANYRHRLVRIDKDRITEISNPTMTVFPAINPPKNGQAMVIFPGGGYRLLSAKKEGAKVAKYFAAKGITCFVVHYRVSKSNHQGFKFPGPLLDARESIRIAKFLSSKYGYSAKKVGVMGFSAGGHLAAMCATRFDDHFPEEFNKSDCRPAFAALIYPVASMVASTSHRGSRDALFGTKPSRNDLILASPERRVQKGYPPLFIAHNQFDPVDSSLSLQLADSYKLAGVPCSLHYYSGSAHGFGLGRPGDSEEKNPAIRWPKALDRYLKLRNK